MIDLRIQRRHFLLRSTPNSLNQVNLPRFDSHKKTSAIFFYGNHFHSALCPYLLRRLFADRHDVINVIHVRLSGPRLAVVSKLLWSVMIYLTGAASHVLIPSSKAYIYQLAFALTGFSAYVYSDGIADLLDPQASIYGVSCQGDNCATSLTFTSIENYVRTIAEIYRSNPPKVLSSSIVNTKYIVLNLKVPGGISHELSCRIATQALAWSLHYASITSSKLLISPHKIFSSGNLSLLANSIGRADRCQVTSEPISALLCNEKCLALVSPPSGAVVDAIVLNNSLHVYLLDLRPSLLPVKYKHIRDRLDSYIKILLCCGEGRITLTSLDI